MCGIVRNTTKQCQVTTAVTCYSESWVPVMCFRLAHASDLYMPTLNFKQLYLHTHWKLDTCLYELIYSEQSILPPPKIFTIPPETPCTYIYMCCMCMPFSISLNRWNVKINYNYNYTSWIHKTVLSTVYALENRLHSLEMSINTGEEPSKLKLMNHNYRLLLLVECAFVVIVC